MRKFLFLGLFAFALHALAQDIPDGYYDNASGLAGDELKTALYNIIKGHTEYPYTSGSTDTWDILKETDQDPNNPDNVIGIYSGFSMDGDKEYDNGDGWTREHVWAKSRGDFGTDPGPGTDVHHLRAEDNSTNSARSNRTFAECSVPYVDDSGTHQGETGSFTSESDFVWEPRAEVKGDVARMIFYMATRYEGENGEPDLEIVDYIIGQSSKQPVHGKLSDLIVWHQEDPVDDYEINRNNIIYSYQNNRNPFIDHPEYVAAIWGAVDTPMISIDKSGFTTDFGGVTFGSSKTQSYTINSYYLESDLTISVDQPYSLSLDDQSFSQSVTLTHDASQVTESFTVYLKFEPESATDATYTADVTHSSTNMTDVVLSVSGKEGDVSMVSIAEARNKGVGSVVEITGVVIGGENNSSTSRVIYDGTAGIVIRSPDGETNQTQSLVMGDSVVVSGGLTEYNELLQVNEAPMNVTLVSQNNTLPEPKVLTISQIGESYESQLVMIENVTFEDAGSKFQGGGSDGNFNITDGTGTLVVRIGNASHPLAGATIPSGEVKLIGYIGQFGEDYQISPRTVNDVKAAGDTGGEDVDLTTIAEARTKAEGEVIRVKGIVIGGQYNNTANRVIYDGTAGLVVRSLELGNASEALVLGDSVEVQGGVLDYNGLFEIEQSPVTIEVLNSGNTLPDPQVITLTEVGEDYESELISVTSVSFVESGTFSSGTYTLTDGTTELDFRIGLSSNDLVGTDIPKGTFDLVAYVSQSNDDYQLYTRGLSDLTNVEDVLSTNAQLQLAMVYPNPNEGAFELSLPSGVDFPVQMQVLTVDGKKVFENKIKQSSIVINDLNSGLYLVVVNKKNQQFVQRVYIK